ncbi:hypothetical protein [Nostoc sp.]|uniref:hypothetical protein n=1 Tax=Nostoc sp. TaxID=1180 RepID=UPI002FFD1F1D
MSTTGCAYALDLSLCLYAPHHPYQQNKIPVSSAGTVAFSKQFYRYKCTVSGGKIQVIASGRQVRHRTPIKQVS